MSFTQLAEKLKCRGKSGNMELLCINRREHILQIIEAAMVMREALDKSKIRRNKSLLDVNPTNVLREIRRIFEMQDEALAKADEICGTK